MNYVNIVGSVAEREMTFGSAAAAVWFFILTFDNNRCKQKIMSILSFVCSLSKVQYNSLSSFHS